MNIKPEQIDELRGHKPAPVEVIVIKCSECGETLKDGLHPERMSDYAAISKATERAALAERVASSKPYGGAIERCQASVYDGTGVFSRCSHKPKFVRNLGGADFIVVCGSHRNVSRVSRDRGNATSWGFRAPANEPVEDEYR